MRIHDILRPLGPLLLGAALHCLGADPALAGTSAPGFNLRWDQCYADGGAWNKNFACDTNAGTERLVVSFELAAPMDSVNGIETFLDIASASPTLPAWWQFKNAGTCRQASLGFSAAPPAGSALCPDWSSGQGSGGVGSYVVGIAGQSFSANESQTVVALAVPPTNEANLAAGQEYFAFSITINHAKTVGTGSCAGCQTPVVLYLSSMSLFNNHIPETLRLGRGANYEGSAYASWQNGYPLNVTHFCARQDPFFPGQCGRYGVSFDCVAANPTRSHGSTWGAIKSLYR